MNVKKPALSEIINTLLEFDTAIVSDCLAGNQQAMDRGIKPLDAQNKICGQAFTVHCPPGDNLMLHLAVSKAQPGDILVASTNGYYEGGAWGEIITIAAQERGIQAVVIDGSIRDSQQIMELGFPIFTRSISIKKTEKKNIGKLNVPVLVGGVWVNPGDIILGNADGVVVIPRDHLEEIAGKAQEKVEFEQEIIERIKQGELTVDLFDLRKYEGE
ncbi:4-carboxy-4-hydroxy-2-oxoadipate aldolase/oxaloacetate decarboxylase [Aneurinibacillus terranovensis]|uniref:4-carboxy-4-hydroxy-2-oxoadipate aldolase/oxaloacetate decarboxylase n=1 Tax=Aneurinibacillus terranovensis TaxID=278991 RepID=UPI001B7F85FE